MSYVEVFSIEDIKNTCIYYTNNEVELKFTKEEHIIPAGLGGRKKLSLGYVSDEANELFSPSEMIIQRESFISINRLNFGPGKRGSLNIKRNKNPVVRVLKDKRSMYGVHSLGFIFAGESYILMQVSISFNIEEDSYRPYYYGTTHDVAKAQETMSEFKNNLIKFLTDDKPSYITVKSLSNTKSKFINLGYHEGKWFVTTSRMDIDLDFVKKDLLPDLLKERLREGLGLTSKKPSVAPKTIHNINLDSIQMLNSFILFM